MILGKSPVDRHPCSNIHGPFSLTGRKGYAKRLLVIFEEESVGIYRLLRERKVSPLWGGDRADEIVRPSEPKQNLGSPRKVEAQQRNLFLVPQCKQHARLPTSKLRARTF